MRRGDYVLACPICNEVIGLYVEGDRIPDGIHVCTMHDALDAEIAEQEEERIKGGGKGPLD